MAKLTSIDKLRLMASQHQGNKPWHAQISPECLAFLDAALVMLWSGELHSVSQMYAACTTVVSSDFTEDVQLWPKTTAFKAWVAEQKKNLNKPSEQPAQSHHTPTKKPASRRASTA